MTTGTPINLRPTNYINELLVPLLYQNNMANEPFWSATFLFDAPHIRLDILHNAL